MSAESLRREQRRRELDRRHRVTALRAEAFERNLTCTVCGDLVAVFEAAAGARSEAEHRFLDAASYVCGDCRGSA